MSGEITAKTGSFRRSAGPLVLLGTTFFAALLAFRDLGARPLFSPAEARYAEIGREMLQSGDWIQPRLNHVRYYEKPPLLYWALAGSYAAFGVDDFSSRLPSAVAYIGTTAVTYLIAEALFGLPAAGIAAFVYATSLGPFLFGRFLFTDSLLVFCLSVSLLGLVQTALAPGRLSVVLFYVGMALGGLTKGLEALVFPIGTAAAYCLLFDPDRSLRRRLRPGFGALVLLAVFAPWHALLAWRDPSFLYFYLINEHVLRFFNRRQPIDYVSLSVGGFWASSLLWLFPWVLFLPAVLAEQTKSRRAVEWLPLLWAASVLGFFTSSAARLEYYALPAFPALAVAVGGYWSARLADAARRRRDGGVPAAPWGLQLPAFLVILCGAVIVPFLFLSPDGGTDLIRDLVCALDGYYRQYLVENPGKTLPFLADAIRLARPFSVLLLLLGGTTWLAVRAGRTRLSLALWVIGMVPVLGFVDLGMRLVSADRSQQTLAEIIKENWDDRSKLVIAGPYEDRCGAKYYTREAAQMLDGYGGDLWYGYQKGDGRDLFLSRETFQREWASGARLFVLGDASLDVPGGIVLARGPRHTLITNRPLAVEAQAPADSEVAEATRAEKRPDGRLRPHRVYARKRL